MRDLSWILLFICLLIGSANAQERPTRADTATEPLTLFRIATGETGATYYAIGSEIANAISNPPGGTLCGEGGACGVPNLLAVAMSSAGSVDNIRALRDGQVESAFVQADIAYAAQTDGPDWPDAAPVTQLRAIAALYPEAIHIVARADAGITRIDDLAGKRVSINRSGSGTRIDARLVLRAAGLPDDRLFLSELPTVEAARQLRAGQLDAFFMVGGWPVAALTELAGQTDIRLLPISGALADRLGASHSFLQPAILPAETYPGQETPIKTLSVAALWVTTSDQPEALIHDLTRVLWNDYTLGHLRRSHPAAGSFDRAKALSGISIPLHPGAETYYRGAGLLRR